LIGASLIHATEAAECDDVAALGIRRPVATIPLGIDIPRQHNGFHAPSRRRLLFLGRIHEKKGLDILLRTWRRLESVFPDWELAIVGPGEDSYYSSMRQLAEGLQLRRASFLGPRYRGDKSRCYWESDLFVLPTHSENFGLAVAEALAHGLPAVVTHGAPWADLETFECGWWIQLGEESLFDTLRSAMSMSTENLKSMGSRGRDWMRREFSWEQVGLRLARTYEWLLCGGEPPPWIKLE
jgi:glycosyltransferase involved in cell wall biosynthesis